jgi:hypothetical protein
MKEAFDRMADRPVRNGPLIIDLQWPPTEAASPLRFGVKFGLLHP